MTNVSEYGRGEAPEGEARQCLIGEARCIPLTSLPTLGRGGIRDLHTEALSAAYSEGRGEAHIHGGYECSLTRGARRGTCPFGDQQTTKGRTISQKGEAMHFPP